jgi:hypothetical protein
MALSGIYDVLIAASKGVTGVPLVSTLGLELYSLPKVLCGGDFFG